LPAALALRRGLQALALRLAAGYMLLFVVVVKGAEDVSCDDYRLTLSRLQKAVPYDDEKVR
jgi:hypothetical protein